MTASIKAQLLPIWCSGALKCASTSCEEKNAMGHDLREAIVAAHQSGNGYNTSSKEFKIQYSTVRRTLNK